MTLLYALHVEAHCRYGTVEQSQTRMESVTSDRRLRSRTGNTYSMVNSPPCTTKRQPSVAAIRDTSVCLDPEESAHRQDPQQGSLSSILQADHGDVHFSRPGRREQCMSA